MPLGDVVVTTGTLWQDIGRFLALDCDALLAAAVGFRSRARHRLDSEVGY